MDTAGDKTRASGNRRNFSLWLSILLFFTSAMILLQWRSQFSKATFSYVSLDYFNGGLSRSGGKSRKLSEMLFGNSSMIVPENHNRTVIILFWTKWFGRSPDEGPLRHCSPQHYNCILTMNRSLLSDSSAVVFHIRDLDWNDTPPQRLKSQNFVFFNWESPYHTGGDFSTDVRKWYFNSTMTYRRDSDVYVPYGGVVRRRSPSRLDLKNLISNKTKPIAWLVSNCQTPSGREILVKKLQKYIPVDIYGGCGPFKCEKDTDQNFYTRSCGNIFEQNYKFYLAFENSLCTDYVTEKFFLRLKRYLVPIVLERRHYEQLCPDCTSPWFIAADDFKNVEDMAKYLEYLNQNSTAYYEYLRWHEYFEMVVHIDSDAGAMPTGHWCDLCAFEAKRAPEARLMKNAFEWWYSDACRKSNF